MKKALMIAIVLCVAVISTACINNIAVQELNNKAMEYMQKGDYEAAMNRLQASLDLDATMYETYYNLGVAALNAKKYDISIDALEKGIKLKPDYNDFYYTLGVAQISYADEITDAEEENDENIAKDEDSENDVKTSENKLNDKEKAIELKRSAIENLNKYLENTKDANADIDSIKEMIKQSEEFINPENKTEAGE